MVGKKFLIISLFLLVFIPVVQAAGCCISASGTPLTTAVGQDQSYCDSVVPGSEYIADCTDTTNQVYPSLVTPQCCFDANNAPLDFGNGFNQVYQGFCTAAGYTSAPATSTGQCIANVGTTQVMNRITGTVFLNNATGIPLPGISVTAANGLVINTTTNANGFYDLGDIPGVDNGANIFTATAPSTYALPIDGVLTNLICQSETVSQVLTGPYSTQSIDFVMQCQEVGVACVENWTTTPWGDCTYFAGEFVKFRTTTDDNSCGTTINRPITVLRSITTGPEASNYDCPVVNVGNTCGNGVLEPGEQCEPGLFYAPGGGSTTTTPPQCSQYQMTGTTVSCGQDCALNFDQCLDDCAICQDEDDCDRCPSCQGNPMCESTCENKTPVFMDHFTDFTQTRNIFASYENMQFETGVFYTPGTNDVTFKWMYNEGLTCTNSLFGFKVKICEDSGSNTCRPQTQKEKFVGVNDRETIFEDVLEPNTDYCYNVCSIDQNNQEHCVFIGDANNPLPCFNSGDLQCHATNTQSLSCAYDTVTGMNQPTGCLRSSFDDVSYTNHTYGTNETCNAQTEICVETPYVPGDPVQQGALCQTKAACEQCNGLMSLYAAYDLRSFYGDTVVSVCSDFEFNPNQNGRRPPTHEEIGLCYYDISKPNYIGQYESCETVTSCYDYETQDACSNDPCFKFTNITSGSAVNDCQWNTYGNGEFGIGVCQPKAVLEQDCLRCDNESPTGICDETMCANYGSCYFKEDQYRLNNSNPIEESFFLGNTSNSRLGTLMSQGRNTLLPSCLPQEAVTCLFYDSQEDCEGGQASSLDVVYDLNGNRIGGTNTLSPSNDTFGLGTCKWIENATATGCYKDSDDKYTVGSGNFQRADDCFDNANYQGFPTSGERQTECLFDHEPPQTTLTLREAVQQNQYLSTTTSNYLPVYGAAEINDLTFTVTDNTWASDDIYTRVAFAPQSCFAQGCYEGNLSNTAAACLALDCPIYPAYEMKNYTEDNIITFTSGEYAFYYYSFDAANNLEIVQQEHIYIDTTGPSLLAPVSVQTETFEVSNDAYRTNISISFSIDEPAFCTGTLNKTSLGSMRVAGYDIATYNTSFTAQYTFQEDGTYVFSYTCYDDYNNNLEGTHTFTVEANPSIINPLPNGGVFTSLAQVQEVQVSTVNPASCKFDSQSETYQNSRYQMVSSVDGRNHQYNAPDLANLNGYTSGTGHYRAHTACSLNNGQEVTEQNPGDVIMFTVDQEAPLLTLEAREEGGDWYIYNLAEADWIAHREFRITCDDYHPLIPLEQFGCASIEYCFADASNGATPQCTSTVVQEDSVTLLADFFQTGTQLLYYRAVDNGGNAASWQRFNTKVRDLSFVEPRFSFVN